MKCGAIMLLVLLATGACMVGPDYVRPEAKVNAAFVESRDKRVAADPVLLEWWKAFDDPLLDSLVEKACQQNLSLRMAGVRVLQSMAVRGIAVGELFPQKQEANGSFTRIKQSGNHRSQLPFDYAKSWGVGVDAAWELDFWGKFRRAIEAADAELDVSLANYDAVMVTLVAEVALAYVEIRTLQARLMVNDKNIVAQQDSLRIAEARFRAGATTELDVTQARAQVERTLAVSPALQADERRAMYRLNMLLGTPPRDMLAQLGERGRIPAAPREIAVGVPADLLRRRPDVRLAERQAAAESARVGVAAADLYPAFFVSGSLGLRSTDANKLFEGKSWTGSVSPGFSWPVLNYGRLMNNVRVQDAAFQMAIINYRDSVLAAAQEVESNLATLLGAQDQVQHLALSVTASERSLELSMTQYRDGNVSYTRVLDSQVDLLSAEEALTVTRGQIAASLIATYKALGGGWEIREGRDIVPEETRREMSERTEWGDLLEPDGSPQHDP